MFGKNPIRPIVKDPRELAIESVFYTIQGEGPYAGQPALFIRMSGCNLACHFCDTQFEEQIDNVQAVGWHLADILKRFPREQRRLVVLTGGEPLRQNTDALISALLSLGTSVVQVETAGTLPVSSEFRRWIVEGSVVLVCSPKTPKVHPDIEELCRHWKYVIRFGGVDPVDGLPNRGTQVTTKDTVQRLHRTSNERRLPTIWVSPCDEYDPVKNKQNQDLCRDICLTHGYRLSLQIHKIIGVE